VPEAPVDEHRDLGAAEQDVCAATRHTGEWSVDSVPQTAPVELTSEKQLGLRIARSLP